MHYSGCLTVAVYSSEKLFESGEERPNFILFAVLLGGAVAPGLSRKGYRTGRFAPPNAPLEHHGSGENIVETYMSE
jgi:hypothetical protein